MNIFILYKSGSIEEINTTWMTLENPGEGALLEDNFIDITNVDDGIYLERRYSPVDYHEIEEDDENVKGIDMRLNRRVLIVPKDAMQFVVGLAVNGHLILRKLLIEEGEVADFECGLMRCIKA